MVNEARKAGLQFDSEKMRGLNVATTGFDDGIQTDPALLNRFHKAIHESAKSGFLHDCLTYNKGASATSVAGWQVLEYLVSILVPSSSVKLIITAFPTNGSSARRLLESHLLAPASW
jgi:hypothetical protein